MTFCNVFSCLFSSLTSFSLQHRRQLVQYLIAACAFASIYTLVLMSFDRFLAGQYPSSSIILPRCTVVLSPFSIPTALHSCRLELSYLVSVCTFSTLPYITVHYCTLRKVTENLCTHLLVSSTPTVVHPIASISIRTQKNASNAIVLTWISIMMLCAPTIFLHREHVVEYKGEQLSSCQFDEEFNSALYHLCFFMFSFVIPLTLIFILYVLMLQRLWFGNVPGGQMSNESVRSKVRSVLSTSTHTLPSSIVVCSF